MADADQCRHRPCPETAEKSALPSWDSRWEGSPRTALRRAVLRRLRAQLHGLADGPGNQRGINVVSSLTSQLHDTDLPIVTFHVGDEERGTLVTNGAQHIELEATVTAFVAADSPEMPCMIPQWGTVDDRIDWILQRVEEVLQHLTIQGWGSLYLRPHRVALAEGLQAMTVPTIAAVQHWRATGMVCADQGRMRRAMVGLQPLPPPPGLRRRCGDITVSGTGLDNLLRAYLLAPRQEGEDDVELRGRLGEVRTVGIQEIALAHWGLDPREPGESMEDVDERLMRWLLADDPCDEQPPGDREVAAAQFLESGDWELSLPPVDSCTAEDP